MKAISDQSNSTVLDNEYTIFPKCLRIFVCICPLLSCVNPVLNTHAILYQQFRRPYKKIHKASDISLKILETSLPALSINLC